MIKCNVEGVELIRCVNGCVTSLGTGPTVMHVIFYVATFSNSNTICWRAGRVVGSLQALLKNIQSATK